MKRLIIILGILSCVLFVPVTAFATNEVTTQLQKDILNKDKQPQVMDNEPQLPRPDVIIDAPAGENTYEEQPDNNDTPRPRLADGEAGRGSLEFPDKYWAEDGYPDDISFAYEAGGEVLQDGTVLSYWQIGIVDADDHRKQEIVNMLSSHIRVTFIDCEYSYIERAAAYNEIMSSQDENILDAIMLRNSEEVIVRISEGHLEQYAARFNQQYGSFVIATDSLGAAKEAAVNDGFVAGLDHLGAAKETEVIGSTDKETSLSIWAVVATFLAGALAILIYYRNHLFPALQTTIGEVVTPSSPSSRKETIAAIKQSEIAPSDEVFDSILLKINKCYD